MLLTVAGMNKPVSCGEGVNHANKLVKDMELEEYMVTYETKTKVYSVVDGRNTDGTILELGWWTKFMKKSRHKLTSGKGWTFSCKKEDCYT